jgi:hypothetical protein
MQIINEEYPPNIDDIDKRFGVKNKPNILYCWDDKIYNPSCTLVPDHILVHETVHSVRQEGDPVSWWKRYIEEPRFRLDEEVVAHRSEWGQFVKDYKDRNLRAKYLHSMCQRLSGFLYGNLVNYQEAKQRIIGA